MALLLLLVDVLLAVFRFVGTERSVYDLATTTPADLQYFVRNANLTGGIVDLGRSIIDGL